MDKIIVKDICLSFISGDTVKNIFTSFSYEFKSPGIYAITGPSGCGKTSLLNIITDKMIPQSGDVIFGDKAWSNDSDIYSTIYLIRSELKLREVYILCLSRFNFSYEQAKETVNKKTAQTPIERLLNQQIKRFSAGELRMAEYYLYRLFEADFYCFDEPFAGLSLENIAVIENDLLNLSKSKGVVLTLHPRDEQVEFLTKCTRIEL